MLELVHQLPEFADSHIRHKPVQLLAFSYLILGSSGILVLILKQCQRTQESRHAVPVNLVLATEIVPEHSLTNHNAMRVLHAHPACFAIPIPIFPHQVVVKISTLIEIGVSQICRKRNFLILFFLFYTGSVKRMKLVFTDINCLVLQLSFCQIASRLNSHSVYPASHRLNKPLVYSLSFCHFTPAVSILQDIIDII